MARSRRRRRTRIRDAVSLLHHRSNVGRPCGTARRRSRLRVDEISIKGPGRGRRRGSQTTTLGLWCVVELQLHSIESRQRAFSSFLLRASVVEQNGSAELEYAVASRLMSTKLHRTVLYCIVSRRTTSHASKRFGLSCLHRREEQNVWYKRRLFEAHSIFHTSPKDSTKIASSAKGKMNTINVVIKPGLPPISPQKVAVKGGFLCGWLFMKMRNLPEGEPHSSQQLRRALSWSKYYVTLDPQAPYLAYFAGENQAEADGVFSLNGAVSRGGEGRRSFVRTRPSTF